MAEALKRSGCKAVSAPVPGRNAAHAHRRSREGFFIPPPFRGYHVAEWTEAGGLACPNAMGSWAWPLCLWRVVAVIQCCLSVSGPCGPNSFW